MFGWFAPVKAQYLEIRYFGIFHGKGFKFKIRASRLHEVDRFRGKISEVRIRVSVKEFKF